MLDIKKCVRNCIYNFGIEEKEAIRIATTSNSLLSIQELRYKYNDLRIGTQYPDWITPEEHLRMCYATVFKKYYGDEELSKEFYSVEDVVMDLFIYSAVRIHSYKDKYQLNGLLLCKMKNLLRDKTREASCYYESYNWESEFININSSSEINNNYKKAVKYDSISKYTIDTTNLLLTIESIKNTKIKGILLLCGYFLANLEEFLEPLVNYYAKCPDKIQVKIYELGKDDIYFCNAIKRNVDLAKKENITIGRILKIFGKRSKAYLTTDLLPYLNNIGF